MQLRALDEARLERLERRTLQSVEARHHRGHHEEDPELRRGQGRIDEEHARRSRQRKLGDLHHPAAVERVGERAAEERGREQRRKLGEAEEPDEERRAGEPVDLVRDRDVRHHRAEERDPAADEEQPEIAVPPERTEIDHRQPQQAAHAGPRNGRRRCEPLALVQRLVRQRRAFSARSMSRLASRSATARRLSRTSFPRASASSTLTRPSLK